MDHQLIIATLIGLALDLVFGDPRRMPHIVKYAGSLIVFLEDRLARSLGRSVRAGLALWLLVVGSFAAAYLALDSLLASLPWLRIAFNAIVVFQCIAFKDLVHHLQEVRKALGRSLDKARQRVSWIVGRDTDRMDANDVCRAAVESGSENLNDAVIAPLFWITLLGPLGGLIYRLSNTLDAMVGHRTVRHERIGKVSARIDDVLNFIPARLCALLTLRWEDMRNYFDLAPDARKHPSVNAGWPEAAMSRRLGVVFGGRMYARGKLVQTAEMNPGARQPNGTDIARCARIMGEVYLKAFALAVLATLLSQAL